jgi:hypothetical protein
VLKDILYYLKAHNDVIIRKTDLERLSKIIGFMEKSGREML